MKLLAHRWFPLLLFAISYVAALLYVQPPVMGDDIDYYGYARNFHVPHPQISMEKGFHFLRWPVWGLIWAYQFIGGYGLGSFAFVPAFSVALCCAFAFWVGRRLADERIGLLAACLFFFHPLLNGLIKHPMPDVTEGAIGGLGFLVVWCRLWRAEKGDQPAMKATILTGIALGILMFATWANRPTGLIWVIALMLLSLTRLRLMMPVWAIALPVAAALFAIECVIYGRLFDDFLHSIHANAKAGGRKGTEPIAPWNLPFRFLSEISRPTLALMVLLLAGVGSWQLWRQRLLSGRWIIGWAVLVYLGVACAVQSLFPLRPLVREAARFVGSVALPISVLAAVGVGFLMNEARRRWPATQKWVMGWRGLVLLLIVLVLASGREFYKPGYLPTLRTWLAQMPPGTNVLSHDDCYNVTFMADPERARPLRWSLIPRQQLATKPELLAPETHTTAEALLLHRERLWVTVRKQLESKKKGDLGPLDQNILALSRGWQLAGVAFQAEEPHFFHFKRGVSGAETEVLSLLKGLDWKLRTETRFGRIRRPGEGTIKFSDGGLTVERKKRGELRFGAGVSPIPQNLVGKPVLLRFKIASESVEPFRLRVSFFDDRDDLIEVQVIVPYASAEGVYDFTAIQTPPTAKRADFEIEVANQCKKFVLVEATAVGL